MSFKRSLIMLSLLLSCATFLRAQDQPPPNPQRGGGLVARVQEELNDLKLSDQQKEKITPTLDKARQDFRDMAEEMVMAEPEMRREKLGAFLTKLTDQIKPILTPEQAAQFEQRMQRMREQPRGGAPEPGPGGRQRPGAILERLRDAVESLELSEEQRTKARETLLDARQKLQEMRQQLQGDMQALREKFMPIMQETRQKLTELLTPEQRQKLGEMLDDREAPRPEFARPRPDTPEPPKEQAPAPATQASAAEAATIIAVATKAPDFTLKKLDGQNIQLSTYKGKIVLLVFGSYSSPSFRQRAVALEKIRRDYGAKTNPIVVYTRENHAVGEWEVERNKDEGISVEQPTSMETRTTLARQAREALKITSPIVIDSMDDATAKAYGGFTNAAVLIGRDGTVLFRQKWFEPYALRRAVDEALESSKSAG